MNDTHPIKEDFYIALHRLREFLTTTSSDAKEEKAETLELAKTEAIFAMLNAPFDSNIISFLHSLRRLSDDIYLHETPAPHAIYQQYYLRGDKSYNIRRPFPPSAEPYSFSPYFPEFRDYVVWKMSNLVVESEIYFYKCGYTFDRESNTYIYTS